MGQKKKEHWLALLAALQEERMELAAKGELLARNEELAKRQKWLERQYEKAGGVFPVDQERISRAKKR